MTVCGVDTPKAQIYPLVHGRLRAEDTARPPTVLAVGHTKGRV